MTDTEELLFRQDQNIGWVTFNRPRSRNALTFGMYSKLAEICSDPPTGIKAIIITGSGEKAFAAGTDISQFRDFTTPEHAIEYEATMDSVLDQIERCPVPTIATASGACTGGGAVIASSCDIRLCSSTFRFGFPIARTLGNCLSAANLARLGALIGPARVREIIFSCRFMEAEESHRIGLVSQVCVDHSSLLETAENLARQISTHAPLTLQATKEIQRRIAQKDIQDKDWIVKCYTSEDFREGLDAFLTKREPNWRGR